ncbi:MAG TPA: glycosyltransferase family 4 protein [Solirubrobacterales bacterium]|nr:glycosyltransferase family 4 protein [Solirubrobacterales bacterium]
MRIGLVTKWFASGQAVVSRYIRSALDELGHETVVLAKPGKGPRAQLERTPDPVWDQPRVTQASQADVSAHEYAGWAEQNSLDVVLCDQNDQFEEIGALRARGVRTIGRFVWEHFAPEHAEPAKAAYDVIYSFTRAERLRYRGLGIDSPLLVWGCHPELIEIANETERDPELVTFVVPGSFMGKRKPFAEIVEAFTRTGDPRFRLLVRGQVDRKGGKLLNAAGGDERVVIELEDRPTDEHLRQFASCDVCLSPSRWEGLGLPLYEAVAFGMPSITNDSPPMNEIVIDGVNGICVDSVHWGEAGSGIPAFDPDFDQLTDAIERLGDGGERARLTAGALELRDGERSWSRTVDSLAGLLERVG